MEPGTKVGCTPFNPGRLFGLGAGLARTIGPHLLLALACAASNQTNAPAPANSGFSGREQDVSRNWKFQIDPGDAGTAGGWAATDFDDTRWPKLDAQRSWSSQGYYNYSGVAWYRKRINVPPALRGKFILFHGYRDAGVFYLNGREAARRAAADPELCGASVVRPAFRIRLPDAPVVSVAIRLEGEDDHHPNYSVGPGLSGGVSLSDKLLMECRGYWLAPDQYVTREQWLAALRAQRAQRRAQLALDGRVYRGDFAWNTSNFVEGFVFLHDRRFYSVEQRRYLLDDYLDEGLRRFGGYDSLLLWHMYPNIGVDEENQFEMLRHLPGGLRGLRELIARAHARGVKIILPYGKWDQGTRKEPVSDIEAVADMVSQVGADGVFMDTEGDEPQVKLRQALDGRRSGVMMEPEGAWAASDDGVKVNSASWGETLPDGGSVGHARGISIAKWTEPRHVLHYVSRRWRLDRATMFQHAFLGGAGVVLWDNIFGSWNRYTERELALLRRMVPIQRQCQALLTSEDWEPFYPTLQADVDAHYWPGSGRVLWTLANWSRESKSGPVLRTPFKPGTIYFDLWNGLEIKPALDGATATLAVSVFEPRGLGAILAVEGEPDPALREFLARQRREATRPLADYSNEWRPPAAPKMRFPAKTATVKAARPPLGMVLAPAAGRFSFDITHNVGEESCYPDENGGEWPRLRYFMFEDGAHTRNITHHVDMEGLPAFFIDQNLVTEKQYQDFLERSGYRPADAANFLKDWDWQDAKHPRPRPERAEHPVTWVGLEDARAYAARAGKRLPTEWEWQYAAGGPERLRYPWGNSWQANRANDHGADTTPVGAFPEGRSPLGLLDMSGNVWQWTESERDDGNRYVLLRGGSYYQAGGSKWYFDHFVASGLSQGEWSARPVNCHAKFFLLSPSMDRKSTIGFRCVVDVAE